LDMDRAGSVGGFREAMRPWHVPTFCLVIADGDGNIALQPSGRIPQRNRLERGYRRGWDPEDRWTGLMPFEMLPHAVNPDRGWLASANNRLADDSYPCLLFGCWSSGHRGRRIRAMFEEHNGAFTREDFGRMQRDAVSLRAVECLPRMLEVIGEPADARLAAAVTLLSSWDGTCEPDQVGPTLFNVFYRTWCRAITDARFDAATAELLAKGVEPIAGRLLADDPDGWFPDDATRRKAINSAFAEAVESLADRFGPDPAEWTWGRLHRMPLKHVLSGRGDLAELLDHGGAGVRGDMMTVGNTGAGPDWEAASGGGYRHLADFADDPPGLWTVDGQGQSGQPGSPHYADQYDDWLNGDYRFLPLGSDGDGVLTTELVPES